MKKASKKKAAAKKKAARPAKKKVAKAAKKKVAKAAKKTVAKTAKKRVAKAPKPQAPTTPAAAPSTGATVTRQPQVKQQAAVASGMFLYTDDAWSLRYFNPNDLHSKEREVFG